VLVGVATFGPPRFSKKSAGDWELLRLCYKTGISVTGGSARLLAAFAKAQTTPGTLWSYASLDHVLRTDNVYTRTGFSEVYITAPGYAWYKAHTRLPRYQTQKHKLLKMFPDVDPLLSEAEIMRSKHYHKVYDAGNILYQKSLSVL